MKKFAFIMVSLVIVGCLVVTGCGGGVETAPTTETPASPSAETPTDTPVVVPEESTPVPGEPISKDKPTIIKSISNIVGEGEASFLKGVKSGTLKLVINGTLPVNEGKQCLGCFETIKIGPKLSVPMDIFTEISIDELSSFVVIEGTISKHLQLETVTANGKEYTVVKDPPVIDYIGFYGVVLEIPIGAEGAESIVSGPDGATLKKVGNGFLLLEGEAYLVD